MLTLGALLFERASLGAAGLHGAFGWAASAHYLPYVTYLAAGPGIVGHTGKLAGGLLAGFTDAGWVHRWWLELFVVQP